MIIKLFFDNIEILFKWNKNRTSHGSTYRWSAGASKDFYLFGFNHAHELWLGNVTGLDRSQRFIIIQTFGWTLFYVKMNYGNTL